MSISPVDGLQAATGDEALYRRAQEMFKQAETEARDFRHRTAEKHRAGIASQLGRSAAAPPTARSASTLDSDILNIRRLVEYSTSDGKSRLIQAVEEELESALRLITPLQSS